MKKKKSEPQGQEQHIQYLQKLHDERIALNKLIKKLEKREHLKSKPSEKPNPKA